MQDKHKFAKESISTSLTYIRCFCLKEFSSKVNLLLHQKTVKNCLKLQGKEEKEANIVRKY